MNTTNTTNTTHTTHKVKEMRGLRAAVQLITLIAALSGHAATGFAQNDVDVENYFVAPWRAWDVGYFASTSGVPDGGFGPEAMATGDMDGDGIVDVVMSHSYFGFPGVSVMLGEGAGVFGEPVYYRTSHSVNVIDLELYDFDADGDLDVFGAIYGNSGSGNAIGLWRNNGNGVLAAREHLSVGQGPWDIEIADVTGDGIADLVVTEQGVVNGNDTLSMRAHNGLSGAGAGFLPPVASTTVAGALGLAVVDMDGDGLRDVVVGGNYFRNMGVGINQGDGSFAPPMVTYDLDFYASYTSANLIAADFDNDGDNDVGTSSGGALCIWRNDGTGALTGANGAESYMYALPDPLAPGGRHSGVNGHRLKAVDINEDGWIDILSANSDGRRNESWNVVLNDGTGTFLDPLGYHCSQNTYDIDVADVDTDGDLDVLTIAHFSSALTVHLNQGDADFRGLPPSAPAEGAAEQLAVGDLDLDGDLDAVTIGNEGTILRNTGTGELVPDASPYVTPHDLKDVILVDLNGDTYPDMVMGPDENSPPYVIGVSLNDGTGSFLPGTIYWPLDGSCGTGTLATGDLDNDGDIDIALSEEQGCFGLLSRHIFLFENDGSGGFTPRIGWTSDEGGFGLAMADFDDDGNLDLITTQAVFNQTFTVYLGNGDMTFSQEVKTTGPIPPSRTYLGLFRHADFNQDGILDVAALLDEQAFGTNILGVFLGNGDGTFASDPVNIQPASSTLETLRVGKDVDVPDVDGDGDPDVVITSYASNDYSVFINDGAGGLTRNMRYGANVTPRETAVADMNGDGIEDLCTLATRPGYYSGVIVLLGRGGTDPASAPEPDAGDTATLLLDTGPNPFSSHTTISYEIPSSGEVEVAVFNAGGQQVRLLRSGHGEAGRHVIGWNGASDAGRQLGSGVYYVVARAGDTRAVRKIALLK